MAKCPGLHCPGCGDGTGGIIVFIVIVIIICGAIGKAVEKTADNVFRIVGEILEIALYTGMSLIGLGAVSGITYGAIRIRRHFNAKKISYQAIPYTIASIGPASIAQDETKAIAPASVPIPDSVNALVSDSASVPDDGSVSDRVPTRVNGRVRCSGSVPGRVPGSARHPGRSRR